MKTFTRGHGRIIVALVSALALTMTGTTARANGVSMSTASAGGSYNTRICPAIAKHVAGAGINMPCKPSDGSGSNFDAVMVGTAPAALGQLDVYGLKLLQADDPDEVSEVMASLGFIVPEGLFCAAKKGGRVPTSNPWTVLNDDEAMEKPFKISTGSENSGSAGTLAFLRASFKNFGANTKVLHKKKFKIDAELGRLRAGKRDMVCFVTMPNPKDPKLAAIASAKDLFFVPFDNPQLETAKIGNLPAYKVMEASVTSGIAGIGATKVKTIHTGVAIYVNTDEIDDKFYDALAKAVNDPELMNDGTWMWKLASYSRQAMGAALSSYNAVKKKL